MRERFESGVREAPLAVMLVRVSDEAEAELSPLPLRLLKVRHPLPALVRMEVVRPLVIVVGDRVRTQDFWAICAKANEIGAEVVRVRDGEAKDASARVLHALPRAAVRRIPQQQTA